MEVRKDTRNIEHADPEVEVTFKVWAHKYQDQHQLHDMFILALQGDQDALDFIRQFTYGIDLHK